MNKICLDQCILQTVQHTTRTIKKKGYFIPSNLCPYRYHGKTYQITNKKARLIVHKIFGKPGVITPEGFVHDEHSGLTFFSITRWVEYVLRQEREYHENRRWCGYTETSVLFPDGKMLPVECFRLNTKKSPSKVLKKIDRMNLFKFFYGDKKSVTCILCKKQRLSSERGNAWHAAHVDPRCNGGKLDHPNLVPICTSCNSENSSMHMFDYLFKKNKLKVIADIIRPSSSNIIDFYHQHFASTAPSHVTDAIIAADVLLHLK